MGNLLSDKAALAEWGKTLLRNALFKNKRKLTGKYGLVAGIIGGLIAAFYFYTTGFGIFNVQSHRAIFFSGTMVLIFLYFPATSRSPQNRFTVVDVVLALVALGVGGYILVMYPTLARRPGIFHPYEVALGWITIVLSIEVARRSMGALLPLIAILSLVYTIPSIAQNLPMLIAHRGMTAARVSGFLYGTLDGVFGVVTYSLATYIIPFVILGAFLEKCGAGKFFIELPYSMLGHVASGAAMVSVVGAALMGSIIGSPTANVVATGSFTIPLMKRVGYGAADSAGINTAASSGAMFMPPVMGAAIFFMMEFTNVSYVDLIKITIIPALLFYIGLGIMVHLGARKEGIKGLPASELPKPLDVLKGGWFYFIPLVTLLGLLFYGLSPSYSAFYTCWVSVAVSYMKKETRIGLKGLWEVMVKSTSGILAIAGIAGAVGIFVGILTLTGLGLKFSSVLIAAAGGNLIITIIMVATAAFFLGVGMPIAAVYVVLAVIAPRALMELGVTQVAAHLMLVWYSQLSGITPPVCIVAYAAAAIAEANPFKTGFKALKYGAFLIIIPLLFIYTPIIEDVPILEKLITIFTSLLGVGAVAVLLQNFWYAKLNVAQQILLVVGAFTMFTHDYRLNGLGAVALVIAFLWQRTAFHRAAAA